MPTLFDQERHRLFLWIPVLMGGGILVYTHYPYIPWIATIGLVFTGISFVLRRTQFAKIISLGIACFCLGYEALSVKTEGLERHQGHLIRIKEKGVFQGVIKDQEYLRDKDRYIIKLTDGRTVRLTYKGQDQLAIGSTIQFKTTLLPFSAPILDDGFDYGRAAFYKGLSATGRMNHVKVVAVETAPTYEKVRAKITQSLLGLLPGESGAIAAALVTGERGKITQVTRQAYADAGIAHVLAISGLHLSMIAGLVFMMFRRGLSLSPRLAEKYNLKKLAALATFPFLVAYLLISGMGVPAIRSFIMVSIVLGGVLVDRQAISMRTLALAAIAILLVQPENLTSASFALSFAAVMALISAYEGGWTPLYDWVANGGKWRRFVAYGIGIVASTVIATLATMPITLYIFNRISLQAIIGNLVAIPLMGFVIMPLLLVAVIIMPLGSIPILNDILGFGIQAMTDVAVWTASLPGAAIQVPKPPQAFIWLTVLGGLWLCLWQSRLRYLGIIPALVAISLLWVKPKPFYWLASEGQIYWYDGVVLSTFANSRHNDFAEDILQRQLGLNDINYEQQDLVIADLNGQDVGLLNSRFSWRKHRRLCDDCDVIVSPYSLPQDIWG